MPTQHDLQITSQFAWVLFNLSLVLIGIGTLLSLVFYISSRYDPEPRTKSLFNFCIGFVVGIVVLVAFSFVITKMHSP